MGDTLNIDPRKIAEAQQSTDAKPAEQAKEKQEAKEQKAREDRYRPLDRDRATLARQMARTPGRLGRKILPQRTMQRLQDARDQAKRRVVPRKIASRVNPKHYRRLAKEPILRQRNMRNTPLVRHVQRQATQAKSALQKPLAKQHLRQLIRMRHQFKNRRTARLVIRREVDWLRKSRTSKKSATKSSRSTDVKSKEAFLKRSSKLFTNLKTTGEESKFEKGLKKTLSGKSAVSKLPTGILAKFTGKTAEGWKTFFANVLKQGSSEQASSKSGDALANALYRGLYKALAHQKGMTLVSDLHFSKGDGVIADKFARILINNPDLLARLEQLKPGDPLTKEILDRLGKEIKYTKLVHKPEVATAEAREAAREAALHQLRGPMSMTAMAHLEQSLIAERNRRAEDTKRRGYGLPDERPSDDSERHPKNPWFFWGDPRWDKESRFGKPKKWIFAIYVVGGIFVGLTLYLIFRGLGL